MGKRLRAWFLAILSIDVKQLPSRAPLHVGQGPLVLQSEERRVQVPRVPHARHAVGAGRQLPRVQRIRASAEAVPTSCSTHGFV